MLDLNKIKRGDIIENDKGEFGVITCIVRKYKAVYILWSDGSCGIENDLTILNKTADSCSEFLTKMLAAIGGNKK